MFDNFFLNIEVLENGYMPTRAYDTDAGIDFYSPRQYEIQPFNDVLIPLQIRVHFPKGFALVFKEKSGVSLNKKLILGGGVVDSDYTGILKAHFFNFSRESVTICRGEKVIQAIVTPVWLGKPVQVESVDRNTDRKDGGFGSTGTF